LGARRRLIFISCRFAALPDGRVKHANTNTQTDPINPTTNAPTQRDHSDPSPPPQHPAPNQIMHLKVIAQNPEGCRLTVAPLLNLMLSARLKGAEKRAKTMPSMHMSRREEQITFYGGGGG